MPTDNPKVSAYVPQVLKERLTQFRQERNVSESQAVTIILAEYFQMQQEIGRTSDGASVGGVTLARMEAIEKQVSNLQLSFEQRFQELSDLVGNSRLISSLQVDLNEPLSGNSVVEEQIDEETKDLQENFPEISVDEAAVNDKKGSSGSEPLIDSQNTSTQGSLLLELESKSLLEFSPISGAKLCKRLGKHNQFVKQIKRKYKENPDRFLEELQNEDPDGIPWKPVENGYIPDGKLTSEQKSSLLQWYKING